MTNVAKKSASKYTPEMEARIHAEAPLNQEKARELAAEFGAGFTDKSVIAKATRMGVAYIKKVPTTKSGAKIESKEKIVAEIAEIVGSQLDGLEKATKPTLQAIRDHLRIAA